jgi:hypothetical protein
VQGAEVAEDTSLAVPIGDVAEYLQRLLQTGGGGRVVPGQPMHMAQAAEDSTLARPFADLSV